LSGVKITDTILGQGSYATVLEVKYKGQICAGKKVHELLLIQGGSTYALRRFEEECRLLSQVHHPNIVQFLGVYFQKNSHVPILVMEFLPTNLTSCIEHRGVLPSDISYSILYGVAKGLHYLHSHAPVIIHRDLSSNNVLLTEDSTVAKIADLGVARILNKTPQQVAQMTGTPGTPAYMPPEVMGANPEYGAGVDTFSYGVLMIHVLSGSWPEPQVGPIRTEADKMIPVSEAERREVFLKAIGDDNPLMELILRCISNNPQSRPPSREIVAYLEKLVQQFPQSRKFMTLKMPIVTELAKKGMERRRKIGTYEDVSIQKEFQDTPKTMDKKPDVKAAFTKIASYGKNLHLEYEGGKVRISTSWAQKKFKKAISFFSSKDQVKI
jgi:tyrosine-protein kinase Tec